MREDLIAGVAELPSAHCDLDSVLAEAREMLVGLPADTAAQLVALLHESNTPIAVQMKRSIATATVEEALTQFQGPLPQSEEPQVRELV